MNNLHQLIKNVLSEQEDIESWKSDMDIEVPEKILKKIFNLFDKVGVDKGLPILYLDSTERAVDIVLKYFKEYDYKWNPKISVKFDAGDVASFFYDRDYNLEKIVEDYLKGDYDYDHNYECYDYDHNYMWDDLNDENQKFILEKAKESGIDLEDDDAVEYFIRDEYGSDIGCTWADAQMQADVDALHTDINSEVEELFSSFDGKWDFYKGEIDGKISLSYFVNSEYFEDAVRYSIDDYGVISFDELLLKDYLLEREVDNIKGGYTSDIFPHSVHINTDRHFRYGGAGDMNMEHFNDMLTDRLSWGK